MRGDAGIDGVGAAAAGADLARELSAAVGKRLRAVRRQRGLTLGDVQTASGGEFRISVLGAYERGERGVQVYRLLRLAEIYGVAPAALLPSRPALSPGAPQPSRHGADCSQTSRSFPADAVL